MSVNDRGSISSSTDGTGRGGDVSINVDTLDILGNVPNLLLPASVATSTSNQGNAGNLTINAKNIFLNEGGALTSVTLGNGNAGEIVIEATEEIKISGVDFNNLFPSSIGSAARLLPSEITEIFRLPPLPTGNAGSLSISANEININNGGQISVENQGTGNAGDININTNSISLDNSGSITAASLSGQGGNIELNTNQLQLIDKSKI